MATLRNLWSMVRNLEVVEFRFEWFRNLSIWRYYCDYFPIKVRKTADLDPSKNYLFAFYPHGVIGISAVGTFASNGTDFNQLFPGITPFLTSLRGHFYTPFFREIVLAMGGRGTSQESLMHILDKKKYSGNCVVVVVGGAAEALIAHPGEYKIVLKSRKGFVRVAMKAGAHLVPVFSFGENDLYYPLQNPKNSFMRKFQEKCRRITGVSPVLPVGRGILQKSFGFAPLRRPINVVIGAPIAIESNPNPTQEEVDAVHAVFTQKLVELFESEKSKYLENHENVNLVIT